MRVVRIVYLAVSGLALAVVLFLAGFTIFAGSDNCVGFVNRSDQTPKVGWCKF